MIATRKEIRAILDATALPYDCVDLVMKELGEFNISVNCEWDGGRSMCPLSMNYKDMYRIMNPYDKKGAKAYIHIYDAVNQKYICKTETIKLDRRRRRFYQEYMREVFTKVEQYLECNMILKHDTIEMRGVELLQNLITQHGDFPLWKRAECLW